MRERWQERVERDGTNPNEAGDIEKKKKLKAKREEESKTPPVWMTATVFSVILLLLWSAAGV